MELLQIKDRGKDVFNQVSEILGIRELHMFGLTVVRGEVSFFY